VAVVDLGGKPQGAVRHGAKPQRKATLLRNVVKAVQFGRPAPLAAALAEPRFRHLQPAVWTFAMPRR
jgi:hypothetical protein